MKFFKVMVYGVITEKGVLSLLQLCVCGHVPNTNWQETVTQHGMCVIEW